MQGRRTSIARSAIFVLGLVLSGCDSLPDLGQATGGIGLDEIVRRVKCEMSDAFEIPSVDGHSTIWIGDDPDFRWMAKWTSQIDLQLEIVDSASASPGASFTQPFKNGFSSAAGPSSMSTAGVLGTSLSAVQQNLVVAVGVGVNGQASRTETFSFNYSLAELHRFRMDPKTTDLCVISDTMDLRGRLGLKEWVVQSLAPVRQHLLYTGYHPKPQAAAGTAAGKASQPKDNVKAAEVNGNPKLAFCTKLLDDATLAPLVTGLADAKDKISKMPAHQIGQPDFSGVVTKQIGDEQSALTDADKAQTSSLKSYEAKEFSVSPVLDPAYGQIFQASLDKNKAQRAKIMASAEAIAAAELSTGEKMKTSVTNLEQNLPIAQQLVDSLNLQKGRSVECKVFDAVSTAVDNVKGFVSEIEAYQKVLLDNHAAAQTNVTALNALSKSYTGLVTELDSLDPPFTTLGQSISFIVGLSGNVTPTWTFVKFKGPTGTLFSASASRTHTVNITIGAPTAGSNTNPAIADNQKLLQVNNIFNGHQ